jgi:hypothetical protein
MALSRIDPFYSPERRLARAKKHVENLKRHLSRFEDSKPYKRLVQPDADGIHETHKIKFTKRIPTACDDLAFEALFTLRAVLDQTGYAAAVAARMPRTKYTYFPFGDDVAGLQNVIKGGRCSDLPDEILALFRRFRPYQRGNRALWALNKLRNSAHTSLAAVGVVDISLTVHHFEKSEPLEVLNPKWDSTKNEVVFARGKRGTDYRYYISPHFIIGFDEIDIVGVHPASAVLDASVGQVEAVLRTTERECRRLGFIR